MGAIVGYFGTFLPIASEPIFVLSEACSNDELNLKEKKKPSPTIGIRLY
jgi:hypothetical protein